MLSIQECRKILGDYKSSDKEIHELLEGISNFCEKFLDDYFANPEKYKKDSNA